MQSKSGYHAKFQPPMNIDVGDIETLFDSRMFTYNLPPILPNPGGKIYSPEPQTLNPEP